MKTSDFSIFLSDASLELGVTRFTKIFSANDDTHYESFVTFDMSNIHNSFIAVCGTNVENSTVVVWMLEVTEELILTHMEDDCTLSDENGIKGFGRQFARALHSRNQSVESSIIRDNAPVFPLRMNYVIGDWKKEVTLNIPLLSAKIPHQLFKLLRPSYSTNTNGDNSRVMNLGDELVDSFQSQYVAAAFGDCELKSNENPSTIVTKPAKRRKIGGIHLSANRR